MRRRNHSWHEQDLLQKLKRENKRLKHEISLLRKQISRLDLDRFQSFKEAVDRIDEIEMEQAARRKDREVSREKWRCWTCHAGTLRLKVWDRRDGIWYQRCCDSCGKRTRMKRWNPDVEES